MEHLYIRGESADELLRGALEPILSRGERVETSRGWTLELRGAVLDLARPRARLSRSERRGRAVSAIGEFVWYASGSNEPALLERYIPHYRAAIGDAIVSNGAYGPRLFGADAQFASIIEMLRTRPTSRQAVIQLFDSSDLVGNPRDVPCTCTLQFFIRNGALELNVHMRSNDVYLGLPHDLFSFTMLQELAATMLGLDLGSYSHMVGSLHVYEKNLEGVNQYLEEGIFEPREMPAMPSGSSLASLVGLVDAERRIRAGSTRLDELNGYWGELAMVLLAWDPDPFSGHLSPEAPSIRAALQDSYFDIYLSDLQFRGEVA